MPYFLMFAAHKRPVMDNKINKTLYMYLGQFDNLGSAVQTPFERRSTYRKRKTLTAIRHQSHMRKANQQGGR